MSSTTAKRPKAGKPAAAPVVDASVLGDVKAIVRGVANHPEVLHEGTIATADIAFDTTDRLRDERGDESSIESLAASLQMHGQLAPIVVTREGSESKPVYRLVCGRRRLLAARRCGWSEIAARVVRFKSPIDMLAYRETENLQRLDLTPVEEAIAVAHMLDYDACGFAGVDPHIGRKFDSFTPEIRQKAVAAVAARLGKPERWVRDRAFLVRLDEPIRQKVMSGEIPLGHAREIAKLADPRLRSEAARACFSRRDGLLVGIEELRKFVAKHLYSLAQVSWRLDVSFDGKPACLECPHNSANQPGLFEHSAKHVSDPAESKKYHPHLNGKEPKAGVCTLPSCYQGKAAAASRAVASAATAVIKAKRDAKPKLRLAAVSEAMDSARPAFVPREVVLSRVAEREATAKNRPKSPIAGSASKRLSYTERPEYKAEREFNKVMRERAGKLDKLVDAHFQRAKPGQWTMLQLALLSKPMEAATQYDKKKALKAAASPEFRAMMAAAAQPPTLESILAVEKYCGTRFAVLKALTLGEGDQNGVYELVAAAYGIKLPEPAPTYEAILAKHKGEKPAAALDAAKQPAAIAAKRAATKKAPAVDDEDDVPAFDDNADGDGDDE